MKSRSTKLLFILLLMCMLATPAHCIKIHAASKLTFSNGKSVSTVLYANHPYKLKLKGRAAYFYSNNNYIMSVNKRTGKLTVKEPGVATISVKSRYSGVTLCKKTFIVRRRTDYLYTSKKTMTMVTGETAKVTIKRSPLTSTDVIRYQSSNTNIIKVNALTGQVTAIDSGTAYVTAYSKADASIPNTSSANKSIRIKIKVYSSIASAKQVGLDQVEVTFSGKPAPMTYRDFKIVNSSKESINVVAVSLVDNTALLTLGKKVRDGKQYTVYYKSSSSSFTATDGKIAKFVLSQTKVPINVATPVTAYSYDKYGIQIGEYIYGSTYPDVTFTVYSSYVTADKKLNFTTTKGTALARLVYTETVNGIKKTIVDSGSITITSFDPELVSAQYRCHITKDSTFTFTSTTECNQSVSINSGIYFAYFNIISSSGKEFTDYSRYTIESTDSNILAPLSKYIDSTQRCIQVIPAKEGTAYLIMKDLNGSPVFSFPVTVRAASVLSNITLSNNDLFMPNDQLDTATEVKITAVDQFGSNMNDRLPYSCSVECISTTAQYVTPAEVNANSPAYFKMEYPKLTFLSYQLQPGTYTYKISMNNKASYVTVIITGNPVRTYQ